MKYFLIILAFTGLISMAGCNQFINSKPEVLIILGGHSFDTLEFIETFNSFDDFRFDTTYQPSANQILNSDTGKNYDAYIFYDMWKEISKEEEQTYYSITKAGKPLLFLHHSLASYQSWPEFRQIIGGKYRSDILNNDSSTLSGYKHDIDLEIKILDPDHPIVDGLSNFKILDEGYSNLDLNQTIHPFLGTDHPDCHPVIGWTNSYNNSQVVYLILGHDKNAYENENFQILIKNSLNWLIQ